MKPHMHLAIDVSWTQVETTWREPGARVALPQEYAERM